MDKKTRINLIEGIIFGLLLILTGVAFLYWNVLEKWIFVITGILMIIFDLPTFIESCKTLKYRTQTAISQFISALLIIIFGLLLIIFRVTELEIMLGVLIIIFSFTSILLSKNRWYEEFKNQLPTLVLGGILIVLGITKVTSVLFLVLGWVSIGSGIAIVIASIIFSIKNKKTV